MSAPATRTSRLRRPELRMRRQAESRGARAAAAGSSATALLDAEYDHLRRVLKTLPADKARGVADQATRAITAITAVHPIRRRKSRRKAR